MNQWMNSAMAKVLVVDDEESIIWIFRKLIEGMGHAFLSSEIGRASCRERV